MANTRRHLLSYSLASLLLAVSTALPAEPGRKPAQSDDLFSMDLDLLSDIKVITASKFAEKLSDAPGAMSIVTSDELRRFGGTTLREVLERVSGLTASAGFFGDHSLISIRGDQTRPDGGHTLMLINGRPTREIFEGGISSDLLESFPVGALERIEIIKGPGSVLYGSDAYSGVINLITKTSAVNGLHVATSGGASGAQSHSAEIGYRRGDFNLLGAGQFHNDGSWRTPYRANQDIVPGPPGLTSRNIDLGNQGEGAFLGVNYKAFSFMSSYTGWLSNAFVLDYIGQPRWKRGFADLGYHLRANAKWEMNFNFTYSRNTFDMAGYPDVIRDSHESVLEWTNFVTFSQRDRLTFGALYNHVQGLEISDVLTPGSFTTAGDRSGAAFDMQHEHRLPKDLSLVGGFQAIKIGSIALKVVPRAGIIWNPSSRFTAKALYGQAFRAPSIVEIGLHHPRAQGNPSLTPEKVGSIDLGVTYRGNRVQAGINLFRSRQSDNIAISHDVVPARFVNLGTATSRGMEADVKYYFLLNWFVTGSVLNQLHGGGTAGNPLPGIPRVGAKAGLSYLGENGLLASIFDVYTGPTQGPFSTSPNPTPQERQILNSHVRFDLSKHMLKDGRHGFAFYLHGENLTNKRVWLPNWGGEPGNTMPIIRGRNLQFGLEVWAKNE